MAGSQALAGGDDRVQLPQDRGGDHGLGLGRGELVRARGWSGGGIGRRRRGWPVGLPRPPATRPARSPGRPCPVSLVRPVKVPDSLLPRRQAGVLDQRAGGGEPVSGRRSRPGSPRAPTADRPVMEVTSSVSSSSSSTAIIRCSVSASRCWVSRQSSSSSCTRSNAPRPVRGHPGRVGQRGEQLRARSAATASARRGRRSRGVPRASNRARPEAAGAGRGRRRRGRRITRHGRRPGLGPERLLGGVQRGRPHALEQVADLLDLADRLGDQLFAAGAQVPQPAPGLVDRLRDVAAQLRGQPGDQHRVLLVGLVEGQVLAAPRPRGQHRLHTHERHPPVGGQLPEHPPAVPGRLTRHRHPGEALRCGPLARPSPTPTPDPRPGTGTSAAPAPSSRGR